MGWWGHLNSKRRIQGGTKGLKLKEKCKDLESYISSTQHAYLEKEIQESIKSKHFPKD